MKGFTTPILMFLSAVLLLTSGELFAQTIKECVTQARKEGTACKDICNQTKDDAIVNCQVPDGDCGDACKAAYAGCSDPFENSRESCLDTCDTTFETSRETCATQCSCTLSSDCASSACFGACVFAPAVERAVCRVLCYRNGTVKAGLRACRQALRLCARTCG